MIYDVIAKMVALGIEEDGEDVLPELIYILKELPKTDKDLRLAISNKIDEIAEKECRCPYDGEYLEIKAYQEIHYELDTKDVETFYIPTCPICGYEE